VTRVLCWFSCGAASAYAAKLAVDRYGDACEVVYCDTLKYEHPDNARFMADCERWMGKKITLLRSDKYSDIFDVFDKTGWLVGPAGARCTTELKKKVRRAYQRDGDLHVFGYTVEETHRRQQLMIGEPDLTCEFPLIDRSITKQNCLEALFRAGIEIPIMYRLGYSNNNCIGCVKGGAGYWNRIRRDFPDAFQRMARQERKMNVAILKRDVNGQRVKVFLDELPETMGRGEAEPNIECGVLCLS
jgi:3'-phosphoadenosine 5'-phosphosulfate sulfotransferase (PAPS reductase)/FAD synthetase